ncbi:Abi family protein [Paraoerskovia marina]|uniref:Abi family protein n=1 Tax=Paraoerskovia marina TaxID=545619 RepID=UPI003D15E5E9
MSPCKESFIGADRSLSCHQQGCSAHARGRALTIGQLKHMYVNLLLPVDKTAVAKSLNLTAPVLKSWMATYVRVRNICAHHGRLWNVGLGVYPRIPSSSTIPWSDPSTALPHESRKRLYPALVSLQSVLTTVSARSSWAERLRELVDTRPPMNLRGMGFPDRWSDDPLWAKRSR